MIIHLKYPQVMVPTIEINGISSPPLPHPTPNTQKTPHTSCIAAPEKLDRNLKMAHIEGRNM